MPRGSQTNIFLPEYRNFLRSAPNLSHLPLPACPFPGGLGGRSRIEFIVSPLPRRRHNESHFAAQSPERSFFFPLFLSPRKKKRLLAATQSENLCHQIKIRQKQSDTFFHSTKEGLKGAKRREKKGKTGDDRMKNPCYTVTARDEIPRWHCGAAGNLSASGRNTSLRTVLPKALFRRLPTGRFRLG